MGGLELIMKLDNFKRHKIKKTPIILLMVFFITIYSSSGYVESVDSPQAITLNILTRHSSTIFFEYKEKFLASDLATDAGVTDVIFHTLSEANWITQAQTGTYDLGWGGGPILFDGLIDAGLTLELNDTGVKAEVDQTPGQIAGAPMKRYDNSGKLMWTAAAISTFGFTVNNDVLEAKNAEVPESWTQISRPEYFLEAAPLIAMGNAPGTTSNTRIYEIIIQKFGWEQGWSILSSMAANSRIEGGSVAVLDAVTGGTVGVSMTIDFYGYGAQLSNPACEYIIPAEQSIVNADPICLFNGDLAKRAGANAFIQFVLSQEGQSLWLNPDISRMPVREDAFDTTIGATRNDLKIAYNITVNNKGIDFNDSEAASYHGTLLYYFEAVFTDAHAEHVAAWKAIVDAWKNSGTSNTPRIQEYNLTNWVVALGAPIVPIEEARTISENMEKTASFRSTKKAEWTALAKTRYSAIKIAAESAAEDPDTTTPTISEVKTSDVGNVSAVIGWKTDEITTSRVDYGLTTALGMTESNEEKIFAHNELPTMNHSVKLSNLVPGGTYYYEITSQDLSENSAEDDNSGNYYNFTLTDTAPPKISNILASTSNDSAIISWNTDEFSDSTVNYGETTSLGSTIYEITEVLIHEITLPDLTPETQYYFEVNSSDGIFITIDDNDGVSYTFTTLSSEAAANPVITTPVVNVTSSTTATITLTTNKPTRATLHYGIGTPSSTMESASLTLTHTFELTGLTADSEYSFYVEVIDAFDNEARYPEGSGYTTFSTAGADTETTTGQRGGIIGFEFFAVLLVLPLLTSIKKKRK
jgi:ABC-type Fe3+ transport system substrate-binding protein